MSRQAKRSAPTDPTARQSRHHNESVPLGPCMQTVSPHGFRRTHRRPQSALPDPAGGSTPHTSLRARITACRITGLSDRSRRCAGSCEVLGDRRGSRCDGAGNGRCGNSEETPGTGAAGGRDPGGRQELTTLPTGPLGATRSGNPHRRRQPPPMDGGRPQPRQTQKPRGEPTTKGRRNDCSR